MQAQNQKKETFFSSAFCLRGVATLLCLGVAKEPAMHDTRTAVLAELRAFDWARLAQLEVFALQAPLSAWELQELEDLRDAESLLRAQLAACN